MDNDSVETLQAAIQSAEIVMPCADLSANLSFFTDKLGFAVAAIFPADDPTVGVLNGHGIRIRLEQGTGRLSHTLRLNCDLSKVSFGDGEEVEAPNGTRILIKEANPPIFIPPEDQSLVISKISESASWKTGRARMMYRDLIPNRQGGRFIASHIQIPRGGPVSDYVHYHKVRFQMIFCYKGWVKVAYEDQGDPILMKAGDCFLQPPEIRHRVLESSDGLEVVEVGCPAEHETHGDLVMTLPTGKIAPERTFGGQLFRYHDSANGPWTPWRHEGFESQDIGINDATQGVAGAHVVRSVGGNETPVIVHEEEFLFVFVLNGKLSFSKDSGMQELEPGDSIVIPRDTRYALTNCSDDLSFWEVTLPGTFTTIDQNITLEQLVTGS
jgi:quercetin dioxygenase-like cupin family protein